jgi:pSer/pThr/pTyr-binding forkhead associated (FHA) protein
MNRQPQEHHVLIINSNKGRQAIALAAAAYSIGRDSTNAIVLDFETVSRQHALLLRVPIPQANRYQYRLIDGNSDGKPSANGIYVNGDRCDCHTLSNGDVITFGRKITASYLTVSMGESEFINYLESIDFQSIKSKQINPKATLVAAELGTHDEAESAVVNHQPATRAAMADGLNVRLESAALSLQDVTTLSELNRELPFELNLEQLPVIDAGNPALKPTSEHSGSEPISRPNLKETIPEMLTIGSSGKLWGGVVVGAVTGIAAAGLAFAIFSSRQHAPAGKPETSALQKPLSAPED